MILPSSIFYLIIVLSNVHCMEYYVAAVYEHNSVLNPNPAALTDRISALRFMSKNLDIYEEQVIAAAEKGAQIIVFPEDGIHGFNYSRQSILPYLDFLPPDHLLPWNPCLEPHKFSDTEILQRLSCIAKKGKMFLVANLGTKVLCDPLIYPCPSDGRFHFNTDIVLDDKGTLIARYFKQNLYFEYGFDVPPVVQNVVFDTPFASKFGILTCFDILFYEPTVSLIEKHNVKHVIYPTAWMNQLPLLSAIQIQRGFATGFKINLLAANIHHTTLGMTGSGIYSPSNSFYHYDMMTENSKLIVARLPVNPSTDMSLGSDVKLSPVNNYVHNDPVQFLPTHPACEKEEETDTCSRSVIEDHILPSVFHAEMMYDNFTFISLSRKEGIVHVCARRLCCYLNYKKDVLSNEFYALGVFDGLHTVHGTYSLQICAVVKCGGLKPSTCGHEVTYASSVINFQLWGNFSTGYIFPLLLTSNVTLVLPHHTGWEGKYYHMHANKMSSGLVTGALYGRLYDED
ncbi:biotinidase isoform X2 [Bombina bombina]|nr:biotinidase isoform X2 [Bombina bombina]